jgi:hypothetical protein
MPAHQGQQCQCDKGNHTSATAQTCQVDGGNKTGVMTVMTPMQHEGKEVSAIRTTAQGQQGQYNALERAAKARWNNQVPSTVPSQLGKSRNLPHTGILMKTYQVR